MSCIQAAQRSFVITDPSLPDNPIIFASKGFLELSGYTLQEVLGRNCRFMQSPHADPNQIQLLRDGIHKGEDTSVCMLNVRADGSEFYNQIFVAALKDSEGNIANYVGVQLEVSMRVRFLSVPACAPSHSLTLLTFTRPLTLHHPLSSRAQVKRTALRVNSSEDLRGLDLDVGPCRVRAKKKIDLSASGGAAKLMGPEGRGERLARRNSEKDLTSAASGGLH